MLPEKYVGQTGSGAHWGAIRASPLCWWRSGSRAGRFWRGSPAGRGKGRPVSGMFQYMPEDTECPPLPLQVADFKAVWRTPALVLLQGNGLDRGVQKICPLPSPPPLSILCGGDCGTPF